LFQSSIADSLVHVSLPRESHNPDESVKGHKHQVTAFLAGDAAQNGCPVVSQGARRYFGIREQGVTGLRGMPGYTSLKEEVFT